MLAFSSLLSAVKPKERTEQYKVLAGMYSLGAYTTPVAAKRVTDLLKLHLGRRAPRNVNACLRKYTAFVEPADKGPPLLWRLTPVGVDRLRAVSGLTLATAAQQADFDTDVAFICALQSPEFDALVKALGGESAWNEAGNPKFPHVYRSTEIATVAGKRLRVVGTTATSMGLTAAAIATSHLVLQFRPRLVVMVGIAAGTRSGNKQFGDVLVADPSVDYNSGKVVFEKGIRGFQPDPYPIGLNPRLRSVLNRYRSNSEVFASIRKKWKGQHPPVANRVHIGPVGAADQVIDDASRVLEIQQNWRKLIGVEMETYGVYRACYEAPDPKPRVVSFKAVCDFAAEKSDSWQGYAAYCAAEFAVRFIASEWDALWST
jgi:nucleoside phosphorylase